MGSRGWIPRPAPTEAGLAQPHGLDGAHRRLGRRPPPRSGPARRPRGRRGRPARGPLPTLAMAAVTLVWPLLALLGAGADPLDPTRSALTPCRGRELVPGLLVAGLLGPGAIAVGVLVVVAWRSEPLPPARGRPPAGAGGRSLHPGGAHHRDRARRRAGMTTGARDAGRPPAAGHPRGLRAPPGPPGRVGAASVESGAAGRGDGGCAGGAVDAVRLVLVAVLGRAAGRMGVPGGPPRGLARPRRRAGPDSGSASSSASW